MENERKSEHEESNETRLTSIENFVEPFKSLTSLVGEIQGYNKAFRVVIVMVIIAVTWIVNDQNYKQAETNFRVEQTQFNAKIADKVRALEDSNLKLTLEIQNLKEEPYAKTKINP
jgi:hypothetical protein